MNFKEEVRILLESQKRDRSNFSWNKAISSGMLDYNKTQTKMKTEVSDKTFIEELDELIDALSKSSLPIR